MRWSWSKSSNVISETARYVQSRGRCRSDGQLMFNPTDGQRPASECGTGAIMNGCVTKEARAEGSTFPCNIPDIAAGPGNRIRQHNTTQMQTRVKQY